MPAADVGDHLARPDLEDVDDVRDALVAILRRALAELGHQGQRLAVTQQLDLDAADGSATIVLDVTNESRRSRGGNVAVAWLDHRHSIAIDRLAAGERRTIRMDVEFVDGSALLDGSPTMQKRGWKVSSAKPANIERTPTQPISSS